MASLWTAPTWISAFYAKFPLIVFEQEDTLPLDDAARPCLWIHASTSRHRPWASTSPSSLRYQLLLLFRGVPVNFRHWQNEEAVPGSSLPVLQVDHRLLATSDIRPWLDDEYPSDDLSGMKDQATYDRAVAAAQLVLMYLLPALLASLHKPVDIISPIPDRLAAGISTILPSALTGTARVAGDQLLARGIDALSALEPMTEDWGMGATHPTPLDALIASHLYAVSALPNGPLRDRIDGPLAKYMERVLDFAEQQMRSAIP
ncbi:hypothetical protein BCR39DRAFT_556625 [Naematelia encephala]|uniref:GST N-terminal domain-containing protein n=1 Tax=Naematelia encephala TaxID=71784 RepID=A0A1Y2BHG5_9TREE|nr:hypothetical protein BCR39DRAFT_556625 [Naematelia encephala]